MGWPSFWEEFAATNQYLPRTWVEHRNLIRMMHRFHKDSIQFLQFIDLNAIYPLVLGPAFERCRTWIPSACLRAPFGFVHKSRLSSLSMARSIPFGPSLEPHMQRV